MKRFGQTRSRVAVLAAFTLIVTSMVLWAGGIAEAALVPPQNPSTNISPSATYAGPCADVTQATPACPVGLSTLDADRQVEGVIPMSIPADFSTLTSQEQVFVLANFERVDRGLTPINGLASSLDALAQNGAQNDQDPTFPSGVEKGGSNWAEGSPLAAYELWMYEDGWNGANTINEACTSPSASGCWGHRDNILGTYPSPALMGAGVSTTSADGASTAELFVGGDTTDTPYFTWSQVTSTIPVGVFPLSISDTAGTGTTKTSSVELWASGESMNVQASISGGNGSFSLTPASCNLAAGASCELSVQYAPTSAGSTTATLTVTGPNGPQNVTLAGVASGSTTATSSTTTTSTTSTTTTTTPTPASTTGTTTTPSGALTAPLSGSTTDGDSSDATSASGDTGSLAETGMGEGAIWVALSGALLLLIGILGRKTLARRVWGL
jgi:hypothetical protein